MLVNKMSKIDIVTSSLISLAPFPIILMFYLAERYLDNDIKPINYDKTKNSKKTITI